MVWRIGKLLEIPDQLRWLARRGFEAVSLHASAGEPGVWRGVDPLTLGEAELADLVDRLAPFRVREVHAPYEVVWTPAADRTELEALSPSLALASGIGASILTVHGIAPQRAEEGAGWAEALRLLDGAARQASVTVGLENLPGQPWFHGPKLDHVGVTLDVGHLYSSQLMGTEEQMGPGQVATSLGAALVNVHVHDHDGVRDHLELGTGRIDLSGLLAALSGIGYRGVLCLELDPDRVSPEGIVASRELLTEKGRLPGQG
jgi:sugar phosphate isomerase/epimerase